ncbi:hypothetical protein K469DRAFT_354181 [Zopfia rhizophila CBS 207.26]|uniref:Uncharacterized protein n=1 Tax=Zopfia rhizophila CBS 207.26 TaxID=1314779 RepID=A0A6A6DHF0_9PEZI|nr:hypothetical protein K469DRAFT_354181 [Zopfia rhizophila CBS 207.26]
MTSSRLKRKSGGRLCIILSAAPVEHLGGVGGGVEREEADKDFVQTFADWNKKWVRDLWKVGENSTDRTEKGWSGKWLRICAKGIYFFVQLCWR